MSDTTTVNRDRIQFGDKREEDAPYDEYRKLAIERIQDAELVVLTDGDADGIAAAALIDHVFSGLNVEMIPIGPHKPAIKYESKAFDQVVRYGREDMSVFVLDTCFGDERSFGFIKEPFKRLCENARVHVFDHHTWEDEESVEFVQEHSTYCEIDSGVTQSWFHDGQLIEDRATVKMVLDYFVRNGASFPDEVIDRSLGVSVGDTWVKDDDGEKFVHGMAQQLMDSAEYVTGELPLSDRYTDDWWGYQEWVESFLDTETPLGESVIGQYAQNYRQLVELQADFIKEHSDFCSIESINGVDVAFIYGSVSPNDMAQHFRTEEGMDLVVIIYPYGGCSFRGSEEFDRCQELASIFGGGGHDQAAGARFKSRDDFDMDEHQETCGEFVKNLLHNELESF